jgi:translation initiation factor 2 alpha subunit (eIF-2alpha)
MKVLFKSTGASMRSGGIVFKTGEEYTVSKEVGEYLLNTFGDSFKILETKAAEEKPKAAEEKPKAAEEKPKAAESKK